MHPVKRERARKRMSLRQLGEASGVDFATIGRIERREREPNIVTVAKLADALEVDLDVLTGDKPPEPWVPVHPKGRAPARA